MGLNSDEQPILLGLGSYGDVFLATHLASGTRVAENMFHGEYLSLAVKEAALSVWLSDTGYTPQCFGTVGVVSKPPHASQQKYLPLPLISQYIGHDDVSQSVDLHELLKKDTFSDLEWVDICLQVSY